MVDSSSCQGQFVSFVPVLVQLMVNRRLHRLLQALAYAMLTSVPRPLPSFPRSRTKKQGEKPRAKWTEHNQGDEGRKRKNKTDAEEESLGCGAKSSEHQVM